MVKRAHIKTVDIVVVHCDQCGREKSIPLSTISIAPDPLSIPYTCQCGHTFTVALERRRLSRKKCSFHGALTKMSGGRAIRNWVVQVTDLSRSGLALRILSGSGEDLAVGDTVIVRFVIDDADENRLIIKKLEIRSVRGLNVGAEYCSDDPYDEAIGYFVSRVDDG